MSVFGQDINVGLPTPVRTISARALGFAQQSLAVPQLLISKHQRQVDPLQLVGEQRKAAQMADGYRYPVLICIALVRPAGGILPGLAGAIPVVEDQSAFVQPRYLSLGVGDGDRGRRIEHESGQERLAAVALEVKGMPGKAEARWCSGRRHGRVEQGDRILHRAGRHIDSRGAAQRVGVDQGRAVARVDERGDQLVGANVRSQVVGTVVAIQVVVHSRIDTGIHGLRANGDVIVATSRVDESGIAAEAVVADCTVRAVGPVVVE
jgi:hypothetical protein